MAANMNLVVTGFSSFLGRAVAAAALEAGARVLAVSRRPWALAWPHEDRLTVLDGLDLVDHAGLQRLAAAVAGTFSRAFDVVNCTGYFPGLKNVIDLPTHEARKVMESNFLTVYGVAHELVPLMIEHGGGHFIAFSTHTLHQNYPQMAAFTSAKAAVESLVITIANECLKDGIRANCFALATLLTETEIRLKPHGDHDRWLTPEEVAAHVLTLLRGQQPLVVGNVLHLYKYSKSFFEQSYFDRNR